MNAVDTFRAPSGPLKACMDAATAAEQSFAIRAAIASKNIYEWLDELRDWPWPTEGGIGFQTPAPAKREIPPRGRAGSTVEPPSEDATAPTEKLYLGSLLESDIVRYEARIGQIQKGLDKLDIEEIKRHVLQNHIMPLSRPGTPASPSFDRHFGMPSLASYTKMDDLTAVITATVVQALPNLSKLLRVMNAWRTRLALLRRVPSLMSSLSDAETAVQSGFSTIEQGFESLVDQFSTSQSTAGSTFPHTDFEVLKLGMEKKVSRASRELDYMLDTLEGRDDTLPDEWIDRMEAVEQGFADWITAYEKTLRDAQSAALKAQTSAAGIDNTLIEQESATKPNGDSSRTRKTRDGSKSGVVINVQYADDDVSQPPRDARPVGNKNLEEANRSTSSLGDSDASSTSTTKQNSSPAVHRSTSNGDLDADYLLLEPSDKSREPALPLISVENSRPSTAVSDASTITRAPQDPQRTPDLLPTRGNRGSPHTPPKDRRSASMSLGDMPPVLEDPEDEDSAPTPPSSSIESVSQTLGSPFVLSDAGGEDDHLRRQINEILENIPAKVHLSSQATAVNHLNPPDLQLPYSKPRSAADKPLRSRSSMSSRAGTPSFMLAPVSRPRHQRGNQDIKVYHLSRGTGEPPIKLYIRCVGERVMVRVGGGWADLGEYLKEYAFHHSRRSHQGADSRVEVRDMPRSFSSLSTRASVSPPGRPSPPSRPASAAGSTSPIYVKKTRKPSGGEDLLGPRLPRTPIAYGAAGASEPPSSGSGSTGRSRSSSGISSTEGDSSLGMAGPKSMKKDISQESLEWVESIKEKVRAASSSADMMRTAAMAEQAHARERGFGDIGKIGGTKRLFRKAT
ncbi:hypothetical protein VMCG_04631 [Cytospora schulzeri]|uniref:GAR domain-containing protein n=1 Tax=Cytospora schulzeri TaxID=448051 RepID=A0A423WRN7_9PEZI|nr:hypothetical protein VMCG_04631 [Valsa malicola]